MAGRERRSKESRYEELIDTSARIFAAHGYKDTTIQDIAREMKMTSAAIYYYIESKDDILYEIWRRAGQKLQSSIDEIAKKKLSPEEKIRSFFRSHLNLIMQDKPIFEVLILQRSRLPMVGRDALEEDERKYLETLADIIQSVPAGRLRFKEPKILALGALAMLNGVIRWYSQADRLSLDDVADLYFETFMHGLLK